MPDPFNCLDFISFVLITSMTAQKTESRKIAELNVWSNSDATQGLSQEPKGSLRL